MQTFSFRNKGSFSSNLESVEMSINQELPVEPIQQTIVPDVVEVIKENNDEKYKCLIVLNYVKNESIFPLNDIDQDIFVIESKPSESKWENLLWFFEKHDMWKKYDYVWVPDSNIHINKVEIDTFVKIVHSKQILIGQPSLIDSKKTYIHKILVNKPKSVIRKSHFIENKLVCFKRTFIEDDLLPVLKENKEFLTSGWGIDIWWSSNYYKNLYIIDAVKVDNVKNEVCDSIGLLEMKHYVSKYKLKLRI